jgi:membrane-bound metal-dependent hydrolase YbcI (DUF457 family)
MASYRGHLMFSSVLGGVYGGLGDVLGHLDWGPVFLGAGLTTVGGLLPDLDSDSGVPVRELFGLAAVVVPVLLVNRILAYGFTNEQTLVILGSVYLFIRFVLSNVFRRVTVHRGMYHSLPAMLIAGLVVFLTYENSDPNVYVRLFLAGGVMLGFLSHLLLDELYSVNFMGVAIKVNKYAGSALKLRSPSSVATVLTYLLLGGLLYLAWVDPRQPGLPAVCRDFAARLSAATLANSR